MFTRLSAACAAALALAACATTEDVVSISHTPAAASAVAGASAVRVTVDGVDARTTNRGRIGTKVNGYGMEMAAIRSQQEVADIVEDALEAELKQRGFGIAGGGPTVTAAVETFYNDFDTGMLAGKAKGTVAMTVTVASGGATLYTRRVEGKGEKSVQMASGKNAGDTLRTALTQALGQLTADPAFTAALLGTATAGTTPAV